MNRTCLRDSLMECFLIMVLSFLSPQIGTVLMLRSDQGMIRYIIGTNEAANVAEMLHINTDLAKKIIVSFIRDGVSKVGFNKAVLGLSGGIDSALVAFLAVEALGAKKEVGVRRPYRSSSRCSRSDAQKVID